MKAYIQLYDNYIVLVSDIEQEGLMEIDLPENFNYEHIDWYEYAEGELIYHDHSNDYPIIPSQEERITVLEQQNVALMAQLEAYEQSYTRGVQEA